jgi:hypothetical protein
MREMPLVAKSESGAQVPVYAVPFECLPLEAASGWLSASVPSFFPLPPPVSSPPKFRSV